MIQRIAIDGACRRNGKPDCVSAAGIFVQLYSKELYLLNTKVLSMYETQSTNQRGEMNALLTALEYIHASKIDAQIITDSEYLFNTMTKDWLNNWKFKGWKTASGDDVKNQDLWKNILQTVTKCQDENIAINYYHIKGHCISFGKVTARNALIKDESGELLRDLVSIKFLEVLKNGSKASVLQSAQDLSLKNNGFKLTDELLKSFVVSNIVADAVATQCVEFANLMY